jgi:hypothetical protein
MKHSSRRNPCPICGRDKDDKCRWNDEFILCYAGNTFSPPGYLKVGDRVKVNQQTYALCSESSGFAGNSYCFALVDDFDYRFLCYEDKVLYRRQCVKITRLFLRKYSLVLGFIKNIADDSTFYEMTSAEFYENKANIKYVIPVLSELIEYTTANKRHIVDYLQQIQEVIEATKSVKESLDCIYEFERDLLASPHPEQSDMRGTQDRPGGAFSLSLVSSHAKGLLNDPEGLVNGG